MNVKFIAGFLFGVILSTSWWAFFTWPHLGAKSGEVGMLIIPVIPSTAFLVIITIFAMFSDWDK